MIVLKAKMECICKGNHTINFSKNDTLTGALIYKRNGKDTPLSTSSIEAFSYTSKTTRRFH